jgi:ArsR family transcriptional regulator
MPISDWGVIGETTSPRGLLLIFYLRKYATTVSVLEAGRAGETIEVSMIEKANRDPERFRLHAEVCKVLTDPKRLMLLDVLREDEHSVGELAQELGCSLANASQHLAVLRSAGLVDTRRDGTTIRYRLSEPSLIAACDVIHEIVERRMTVTRVPVAMPAGAGAGLSKGR